MLGEGCWGRGLGGGGVGEKTKDWYSRPPQHGDGDRVSSGLAGQHNVGTTHVPVVVVAHDGHFGGV